MRGGRTAGVYDSRVADDAQSTGENESAPSRKAAGIARSFVSAHGGSARAVVENMGQTARIVLIGEDGAFGDLVVKDVTEGAALVEEVDGLEAHEWDTETTGKLQVSAAHRKRMAGPRAS